MAVPPIQPPLHRALSEPQGWHQEQHHNQQDQALTRRRELLETQQYIAPGSNGNWHDTQGPLRVTRLQLPASQGPANPPLFSPSHVSATPIWRRVLPLIGGLVVNMLLGCMYSLGNIVPYASSYMRYKGRVDTRHSDLGWVFTAGEKKRLLLRDRSGCKFQHESLFFVLVYLSLGQAPTLSGHQQNNFCTTSGFPASGSSLLALRFASMSSFVSFIQQVWLLSAWLWPMPIDCRKPLVSRSARLWGAW